MTLEYVWLARRRFTTLAHMIVVTMVICALTLLTGVVVTSLTGINGQLTLFTNMVPQVSNL